MILVLSFAAVALVPILSVRELAFAICAGLLLDTLVARTLLVPTLVSLFRAKGGDVRDLTPAVNGAHRPGTRRAGKSATAREEAR